jgi:hypothetical protein
MARTTTKLWTTKESGRLKHAFILQIYTIQWQQLKILDFWKMCCTISLNNLGFLNNVFVQLCC